MRNYVVIERVDPLVDVLLVLPAGIVLGMNMCGSLRKGRDLPPLLGSLGQRIPTLTSQLAVAERLFPRFAE